MVNHRMFHLLNVHPRHRFAHLKLAHSRTSQPKKSSSFSSSSRTNQRN